MLNTDQIKQVHDCPFCETGKAHLTIDPERVEKEGIKYPWVVYRCDNCDAGKEGFTTSESDTLCLANVSGVELVQPEGFVGMTPLPWHLNETGFGIKVKGEPTIYATGDDLEIIVKVPVDGILCHRVQDNLANAKYIVEACNKYPVLLKEVERLNKQLDTLYKCLDSI